MKQENPQLIASDPNVSCFVAASAGSGKTKMLVDRLLRLLLKGVSFSSILCLTFTKAASSEMHERLLKKLEEILKLDHPSLIQYLESLNILPTKDVILKSKSLFFELLSQQHDLKIQTIHSFCQNICEKNIWKLGFVPPFHILEEIEQNDLIQKSLDIVSSDINLKEEWNIITRFLNRNQFIDLISQSIYLEDDLIQKSKIPLIYEPTININDIETLIKQLPENILEDILLKESSIKDVFLTKEGTSRKKIFKKQILENHPGLEELSSEIAQLFENLEDERKTEQFILLNTAFFTLLEITKKTYQHLKKKKNALDFEDLIQFSKQILTSGHFSDFEQKLGFKLKAILIDEAQDTSPSQWEIITTLVENKLTADSDHTTSLLIVGDLKQAIYSFQGAKANLFLEKQDFFKVMFKSYGKQFKTLDLIKSFRCSQTILNTVDQVFNHFPKGLFLKEDLKHHAHRSDEGFVSLIPLIDCINNEKNDEWIPSHKRETMNKTNHLAENIVSFVETLLKSDIVLDSTNNPIKPEDIMILVRNRTTIVENITKLLFEKNIPCSGLDRFSLIEHPMMEDFLTLFEWMTSKSDDHRLAKVLSSPFFSEFGISAEDLQKLL